jgi:hypothetical protein
MSKPISIRMDDVELARIDYVLEEACKVLPVTRHRLLKEAIRRGLREVLAITTRNEGIPTLRNAGGAGGVP